MSKSNNPVLPAEILALPFITFDADTGKMRLLIDDFVLKDGSIKPKHFDIRWRLIDTHGLLNLEKTRSRIPTAKNLPLTVETFYNQKGSYLTNRITFESADWSNNTLKLYVPSTHAFYGEYIDDNVPIIQVFERTGSVSDYIYTPVEIDYKVINGFRAAKLIGGDGAHSSVTVWQTVTDGEFHMQIDGNPFDATALNFSVCNDMILVALIINNGLVGGTCTWHGDHFEIESDGTSGITDVGYVKPYPPGGGTDISEITWMSCRKNTATKEDGIDVQWLITLTKDVTIAAFNGLVEVG